MDHLTLEDLESEDMVNCCDHQSYLEEGFDMIQAGDDDDYDLVNHHFVYYMEVFG